MKHLKPTKQMEGLSELEQNAIVLAMTDHEIIQAQYSFIKHYNFLSTKDHVDKYIRNPVIKIIREFALKQGYLEEIL